MALRVSNYTNPFDSNNPLVSAYARVGSLSLNVETGAGSLVVNVYSNAAAEQSGDPPVNRVGVVMGDPIPGGSGSVKTLAELMSDAEFASAYAVVASKLYAEVKRFPAFSGSEDA